MKTEKTLGTETRESEDFRSSGNLEKRIATSCTCHSNVAVFKMADDAG